MRGGGHNYASPPLTFDRVELRGSLIAQKIAKKSKPNRKTIEKFELAVQKEVLTKNTFFDLPPPTVRTLAHHTHVGIC